MRLKRKIRYKALKRRIGKPFSEFRGSQQFVKYRIPQAESSY